MDATTANLLRAKIRNAIRLITKRRVTEDERSYAAELLHTCLNALADELD